MEQGSKAKVIVYICLAAFFFSTMEVALKIAGGAMGAAQLMGLRFLIGGIILAPFGLVETKKNNVKLTAKDIGWLLLVGIVNVPISMYAFQFGIAGCTASTAAAMICMNSIFTIVIAAIFAGEKLTKNKVIAIFICLLAIFFMMRIWDVQEGNTVRGMVFLLIAAITFGAYTVMGRKTVARVGVVAQTSITFIFGAIIMLAIVAFQGEYIFAGVLENWQIVLYSSIGATGVGYLFYFYAIKCSDAMTGSVTFFIKPIIAPILAVIILNEEIYWNTIVGTLLLLTASFLVMKSNRSEQMAELKQPEEIKQ